MVVIDSLPNQVTFNSAVGSGWICNEAALTVTCTRTNLSAGTSQSITISVNAPAVAADLINQVAVSADENDPATGNNNDSETTRVFDLVFADGFE